MRPQNVGRKKLRPGNHLCPLHDGIAALSNATRDTPSILKSIASDECVIGTLAQQQGKMTSETDGITLPNDDASRFSYSPIFPVALAGLKNRLARGKSPRISQTEHSCAQRIN
jgi:hypothetical protein